MANYDGYIDFEASKYSTHLYFSLGLVRTHGAPEASWVHSDVHTDLEEDGEYLGQNGDEAEA